MVVGENQILVFDDLEKDKLILYKKEDRSKIYNTKLNNYIPEIIQVEANEPLNEELNHFIDCIEKDLTPKTDVISGSNIVKILESLKYSKKIYPKIILK